LNRIKAVIVESGFRESEFEINNGQTVVIRFRANQNFVFAIQSGSNVNWSPGEKTFSDSANSGSFDAQLTHLSQWLRNLNRELHAIEGEGAGLTTPAWFEGAMPPVYCELREKLDAIREELRSISAIGALLWQSGIPLNKAVKRFFDTLGFLATLTPDGATYDITVELGGGRRLLIEVTGIDSYINKASNKIGQVLATLQTEAKPSDRVVLAVNAHRQKPPAERANERVITDDALAILTGLKANVVTCSTLYDWWLRSLKDVGDARAEVERLHAHDGGLFP